MTVSLPGRAAGKVVRFIVAGVVNTAVTAILFYGLSFQISPSIAYTVAFSVGVLFSVVVTPRFVFRARVARARRVLYGLWYGAVYLAGLGVVYVLNDRLRLDRSVVVVLTVATSASLSFAGARRLFDAGGIDEERR